MCSEGARVHAPTPLRASAAPISSKSLRRPIGSVVSSWSYRVSVIALSPVASCAVLDLAHAVLGTELRSEHLLRAIGHPLHVRDLVARPQLRRGIAMAIEAPPHRQRLHLEHLAHLIDAAVTR